MSTGKRPIISLLKSRNFIFRNKHTINYLKVYLIKKLTALFNSSKPQINISRPHL